MPHNPPDADRRTDVLLKTAQQLLTVKNPLAARIKHTYVLFTATSPDDLLRPIMERMAARARQAGWNYREMPFEHFPIPDKPREVAGLLSQLT